jgi:predicted membrane-bound spermidine synthase
MRDRWLLFSVFAGGMTTLGVELSASRLLGNVFGTSNIVWANIIGLILIYLTVGYFLGGRWADRSPHRLTFYRILAWGAFTAGLVPVVSRPVLQQAVAAFARFDAAVLAGSFLAVLVLFCVPITLLGCISPFAIRLAMPDREQAGRVSGRIYAVSTLGSIVGTFLPVLWLIPGIGTARTFLAFSLGLQLVALLGLYLSTGPKAAVRLLWMPALTMLLFWLTSAGPIKDSPNTVHETESAYNYIQVQEFGGLRLLYLNEGLAEHSMYSVAEHGPIYGYGTWEYFLAAPFFNPPPTGMDRVRSLGLIGLAAGTVAKQFSQVYGPIPIDGWEIDPEIVRVGRDYFDMNEPNLNAVVADGRWGLARSDRRYDVIAVDAYRVPYIPWQLMTREFFQEARDHLQPRGVVAVNVGRTPDDRRLIEAVVGTLSAVFPSVHLVDVPNTFNSLVYATAEPTRPENLVANLLGLQAEGAPPELLAVVERTIANLQPTPASQVVFTDDRAPAEQLVNSILIQFVFAGMPGLR